MLTHDRLLELLHYDPLTGAFTWKVDRVAGQNSRRAGEAAGSVSKSKGYLVITIDGERHYAHRLAHFYMTKSWPAIQVDHENLDRLDNKWTNLREATGSQQILNQGVRKNSSTGIKGVSRTRSGKYTAMIMCRGERQYLGTFETKEEAGMAYKNAAISVAGKFMRV